VAEDGAVIRQAELYEVGRLLRYSAAHVEDEFGALAGITLDRSGPDYIEMSSAEFEEIWSRP